MYSMLRRNPLPSSPADKIATYLERVDLFFTANETADDKRVPISFNTIKGRTYALLRDLVAPYLPSTTPDMRKEEKGCGWKEKCGHSGTLKTGTAFPLTRS